MTYIYKNENGYGYIQPKFAIHGDGYYPVSGDIVSELIAALPYIAPTIKDGVVVSFAPSEPPAPTPQQPTEIDRLNSKVDYIAMVTGVDINELA